MSTTDETKPAGKSKRRKGKGGAQQKGGAPRRVRQRPRRRLNCKARSRNGSRNRFARRARRWKPQPAGRGAGRRRSAERRRAAGTGRCVPAFRSLSSAAPPSAEPNRPSRGIVESAQSQVNRRTRVGRTDHVSRTRRRAEPIWLNRAQAESSPTELAPVSLQALANAYRDYTRKSIEEFGSFVEQLSGARSLDKAMTVQTEFVKRAYETSVAESHKICELHNRLARQTLDPFKGLTGKPPTSARQALSFGRHRSDVHLMPRGSGFPEPFCLSARTGYEPARRLRFDAGPAPRM